MSAHATGTYEVKTWEENPYDDASGLPKLARASATETYHGDIEGEGTAEYLMVYRDKASASFVRIERVVGKIEERQGSFVLQGTGTFENGEVKCSWTVVPGSATGDLRGLSGDGGFIAKRDSYPHVPYILDYEFE
jgi:Protein of unknown function (DUF3224)